MPLILKEHDRRFFHGTYTFTSRELKIQKNFLAVSDNFGDMSLVLNDDSLNTTRSRNELTCSNRLL